MKNIPKRIAIIGASTGQLPLCLKAKEMGLETFCFAWEQGAVCKDYVDHFIPISIFEKDKIVQYCRTCYIDGVVSNASEATALVVAYVAEQLGKIGTPYHTLADIQDKAFVRRITNLISGLAAVKFQLGCFSELRSTFPMPCVVKPIKGAAKKGVCFMDKDFPDYALPAELADVTFMAETYIVGKEYSVETLSYRGSHFVVQVTEKTNSGAPHFVELGHHQPAMLSEIQKEKIANLMSDILSSLGFTDGAAHIEIKIDAQGNVYLIEVNPRGGGDEISNKLVALSTGYDYLRGMLEVSLGMFDVSQIQYHPSHSGVYFLCQQTVDSLDFFKNVDYQPWLVEKNVDLDNISCSESNYDRNGYVLYRWNRKILPIKDETYIRRLNGMPHRYSLGDAFIERMKKEITENIGAEWLEKILGNAEIFVYMEHPDNIQGWLVFYCNDVANRYAYVASLHVLSEYRRRGIAGALLKQAIEMCRLRNFHTLGLYVNNPIAIDLYSKYGFVEKSRKAEDRYGGGVYSYMELLLCEE